MKYCGCGRPISLNKFTCLRCAEAGVAPDSERLVKIPDGPQDLEAMREAFAAQAAVQRLLR
jgi:hypothetical protein